MKYNFYSIILIALFTFLISNKTFGQQQAQESISGNQFYAGIGLNTLTFQMGYKKQIGDGETNVGLFIPPAYIQFGHLLSKRATLQVGLSYGKNKEHKEAISPTRTGTTFNIRSRTQAILMPVTLQLTLFNADKRLPIYGTASIIPTYGFSNATMTETKDDITSITYDHKTSAINGFATLGLGLRYKINKRFDAYAEALILKSNLNGNNSYYYRYSRYIQFSRSIGLGINYKFNNH